MLLFVAKYLKILKTIIMLLPDNIHPEHSIYYNGAIVLQSLQRQTKQNILGLYQNVKQQKDMTFPVFILCLDWLFLLNIAVINDHGDVELCS